MRDLIILLIHVITPVVRVVQPDSVRAVIAESVITKHQLLILSRSRRRAPNLRSLDRLIAAVCSLWIRRTRFRRVAIAFRPSTFLYFHRAMVQRKYRLLFSPKQGTKPGPKGPTADLIQAVVEMKRRNPKWDVRKSLSRSIWLSEHLSIKMWFAGFSPDITGRRRLEILRFHIPDNRRR